MQGFWQVVDRRWRIFCLLARKKDMSFESWTCGNHWEPWEGLDSTHCWANQWWIDDWICRCLDHFGFLPSPDPPGRAQGPPEVQPTWKSCSGTWFCHIQHPHLMISLLGRVILQGTGCILDFASFRFVGLVTSIASEQQVGKLHVPSWCFFFNFIRESVCMPMVFIYVTILFPETQRYFALGLLAINAVTDQQVQLMVKTENQSWKSPESLHCNWFNGTNIRVSVSSYAGKGGQGVPKNQEQTLSQGLFMTKCPHSLPSPMHFLRCCFQSFSVPFNPHPADFSHFLSQEQQCVLHCLGLVEWEN